MVSLRCKMLVKAELIKLEIPFLSIDLGEIEMSVPVEDEKRQQLQVALHRSGLEVMDDKKAILIHKIKTIIIELIHYSEEWPKVNFSVYLSEKLDLNYHTLSEVFSRTKGITIEHFIILHKIERVKELIVYDELSLSEIAFKMHYSSVAHLSNQFKKITGLTPSFFKHLKDHNRKTLESL